MKGLKILFLTDNFPPETNAPATRTMEHIKVWAKRGIETEVVSSVPNFPKGKIFPGYRNKLYQQEKLQGIKVHRVWTFISANTGTVKRVLDYLSFCISAFFAGLFVRTDIIIATSPQFFTALTGYGLSVVKRKPWIFEVRDLWPESIVAVGAITNTWIIDLLGRIEVGLYKRADRIVVVTEAFKRRLKTRGIDPDKIDVIPNGVLPRGKLHQNDRNEIRAELNLTDRFIIGYLGTHGMAHGLDFVLRSAKKISDPRIHFLFIGDGAEKENLLALKDQLKLSNVTFLSSVPRSEIWRYLNGFDVSLVTLRKKDTFRHVIPSKIFESAAAGLPVLLGLEGESRELILAYECGEVFQPENEEDFLEKVAYMSNGTASLSNYRRGALRLAAAYDRNKLAEKYIEVFGKIEKNSNPK